MKWLIFGKGWIANYVYDILLQNPNNDIIYANSRADNESDAENEIMNIKPDRIVCLIGRTSGPGFSTIDYLEQKGKIRENVRDNLYGPIILALIAKKMGIHLTYMGTGCIFNGYKNNIGYDESDKPDFFDSAYSVVKGFTDRLMHQFDDSVLNVRIRMPITNDLSNKNFIIKMLTYKKICSVSNSMTVLPELLPLMIDMAKNKITGTINLTNPGMINHNEILSLIRDIIQPGLTWENFTLEEQNKILLAGRSNDMLNTDKLQTLYPNVLGIKEAVTKILYEMKDKGDIYQFLGNKN